MSFRTNHRKKKGGEEDDDDEAEEDDSREREKEHDRLHKEKLKTAAKKEATERLLAQWEKQAAARVLRSRNA